MEGRLASTGREKISTRGGDTREKAASTSARRKKAPITLKEKDVRLLSLARKRKIPFLERERGGKRRIITGRYARIVDERRGKSGCGCSETQKKKFFLM